MTRPRGRPFKPGQSGNPAGRPKGSRNKLSEAFLSDFCELWTEFGFDALRKMATRDPHSFASMAAALIPKQSEHSGPDDGPQILEIRWKDAEGK